jgi:succinyl-CoA synthetase beta subunit
MKQYEYMAKGRLKERGITVPPGRIADTPEEAAKVVDH